MKVSTVVAEAILVTYVAAASPSSADAQITAMFNPGPACASTTAKVLYSSFSFTQQTSNRYAKAVPSPVNDHSTYAPPYSAASTLLAKNITTTTYSYNPTLTNKPDGKYGQSAYNALWAPFSFTNTIPFSTTVSPTPVARSELVYPPALYTPCPQVADSCLDCYPLPADFFWGVAGSSWQIEGALQSEGRGPSNLDFIGMTSGNDSMVNNMNYFLYKQDILRLAAIGVPYYSFSIAWPRIVPFGVAGSPINKQGLDHYDDVINFCLANGIKPIVTLQHFDAPLGTTSADPAITENFLYYAQQVMTHYGDRVSHWVTFNELNLQLTSSAGVTNALMAHSGVYKWYKNVLKGTGQITIKWGNDLAVPLRGPGNNRDVAAALRYQDFVVGILAKPLFLSQNYPASVLNTPGYNLTALTPSQLSYINGSIDFFSVDPYVAQLATVPDGGIDACISNPANPLWPNCVVLGTLQANGWLEGEPGNGPPSGVAPQYVRQQLGYLWNTYKPKGIAILEFGYNVYDESYRTVDAQRYDLGRTLYYQDFLREMLIAIYEDNINIIGATAWTYADNNEFGTFTQQYGLQYVNRSSPYLERLYKRSFFDFVDFFHAHVGKK